MPDDHTPGTPPPQIDFLAILGEFSNRLLEVDRTGKKGVLVYLQVNCVLILFMHSHL